MYHKLKKIIRHSSLALVVMGLVFVLNPAFAQPDLVSATERSSGTSLVIPETAVEVAPHVFDLGTAVDPATGNAVQGFAFVHPRPKFHHKPDHSGGPPGGGNGGGDNSCFALISKGAKWKTVEPWIVNASNNSGLSDTFVLDNLGLDISKWEDAADGSVDGTLGADILGDGSLTADVLVADTDSPDDKNEVYFADVESDGAIAVTIVWGVFFGPPSQRELIEWDQIYDDVDFEWSSTGEEGKMDFENIATHELGHSVGLDHPSDDCTEETMYRFADTGETKKRSLHTGDIAGVDELY